MQEEKRSSTRALPQVHKERGAAGDGSLTKNGTVWRERHGTTYDNNRRAKPLFRSITVDSPMRG
jgi:hypothetical protein